jgi:hypothetical protein
MACAAGPKPDTVGERLLPDRRPEFPENRGEAWNRRLPNPPLRWAMAAVKNMAVA